MERYSIDSIVAFLYDRDVLIQRKNKRVTQKIKGPDVSSMAENISLSSSACPTTSNN